MQVATSYVRAHGYAGKVTCSGGIGGINPRTPDFVCQVRVAAETCDQFDVRQRGRLWHVTPLRRGVDCVLPA